MPIWCKPGAAIRVSGLVSRKELNGERGVILPMPPNKNGRLPVRVCGEDMWLKPECCAAEPDAVKTLETLDRDTLSKILVLACLRAPERLYPPGFYWSANTYQRLRNASRTLRAVLDSEAYKHALRTVPAGTANWLLKDVLLDLAS